MITPEAWTPVIINSIIIIRIKLTELTSFDFVYIRAAALINNLSQLRRLF